MADAKTINGYNLKDAAAREAIANLDTVKLASSGGASGSIRFGVDGDGNYGYYKAGADTVTPFKSDSGLIQIGNFYYGNADVDISDYPNSTRDNFLIEIYEVQVRDMNTFVNENVKHTVSGGVILPDWTINGNILHIEGMQFEMELRGSGLQDAQTVRARYHLYYKP